MQLANIGLVTAKNIAQYTYYRLQSRSRQISAMVRVKNEEEFLYAAINSIIDVVDEVSIVDNLSDDSTPEIIRRLANDYPDKVISFRYPHAVRKVGADNFELASNPAARSSPELLSNFYNWCLERCTKPFVLKWDGDMIATATFRREVERFRQGSWAVMWMRGANVHPDYEHLITPSVGDVETLQGELTAATSLSNWMDPYTDYEPRVFPRTFAHYDTGFWWCERLTTPFLEGPKADERAFRPNIVSYAHMKYCKGDPWANFSLDFREVIANNLGRGEPLSDEVAATLSTWVKGSTRT